MPTLMMPVIAAFISGCAVVHDCRSPAVETVSRAVAADFDRKADMNLAECRFGVYMVRVRVVDGR